MTTHREFVADIVDGRRVAGLAQNADVLLRCRACGVDFAIIEQHSIELVVRDQMFWGPLDDRAQMFGSLFRESVEHREKVQIGEANQMPGTLVAKQRDVIS